MKRLRGTKIVEEIKFEGVWVEFEGKNCLQRQSFTKYLTLTLQLFAKYIWNLLGFTENLDLNSNVDVIF